MISSYLNAVSNHQHFGFCFNYRTLLLDYTRSSLSMPQAIMNIVDMIGRSVPQRVEADVGLINQVTLNEYDPGQGIAPHIGGTNIHPLNY